MSSGFNLFRVNRFDYANILHLLDVGRTTGDMGLRRIGGVGFYLEGWHDDYDVCCIPAPDYYSLRHSTLYESPAPFYVAGFDNIAGATPLQKWSNQQQTPGGKPKYPEDTELSEEILNDIFKELWSLYAEAKRDLAMLKEYDVTTFGKLRLVWTEALGESESFEVWS